jgi:hypothetical protein
MMEPNYSDLDPEERANRTWAWFSIILGISSLCTGIIPVVGIIISLLGIISGIAGRKSDNKKIAFVGIIISVLGITVSLVYSIFLLISKYSTK